MNINKVIIWGHTLHDHTHSYIHNAFYKTFKYLNYETYWFSTDGEDNFNINNLLDFNNTLFIVHGIVCQNLPINNTSFYILHNVDLRGNEYKIPTNHIKYDNNENNENIGIPKDNILVLQVFTKACKNYGKEIKPFHYIMKPPHSTIFIPWATDILPFEINKNIENVKNDMKYKLISNFIGMPLDHNVKLANALKKYKINYYNYGGTFDLKSERNKSIEENMKLIQESIIAPALQSEWQIENGYIPCRIFKNISYGKMGITNNQTVQELFNDKLIHSLDIESLVEKGLKYTNSGNYKNTLIELMEFVKENHTYINRINFILNFLTEHHNVSVSKQ
jgi:hypothetical protein